MTKPRKNLLIEKWQELDKQEIDFVARLKGLGERSQRKTELAYRLRDIMQQKMRIEADLSMINVNIDEVLK